MTITYRGWRTDDGCRVTVQEGDGPPRNLPMRRDLANHSPTGFEWGYGGSGPAQLALALLAHALKDDERALRLHQRFKWLTISRLPRTRDFEFIYTDKEIREVAEEIELDMRSRGEEA